MKKLNIFTPFLALFLLLGMLWYELYHSKQHELASPLIGEAVPTFSLPTYSYSTLNSTDLKGHVSLLNIFASWCPACTSETEMLMKIKNVYHVTIYGINYKDKREDVESWLKKYGNPYITVGNDSDGSVAIDLGVYGTPETFVINKAGKIVYRHIGAIDQKTWDNVIFPLVRQYE